MLIPNNSVILVLSSAFKLIISSKVLVNIYAGGGKVNSALF